MTPTRRPLSVMLGVTCLAAELFAEAPMFVKSREGPIEAPFRRLKPANPGVIPAKRAGQHRPRPTAEVRIGRVPSNAAFEGQGLLDLSDRRAEPRVVSRDQIQHRPQTRGDFRRLSPGRWISRTGRAVAHCGSWRRSPRSPFSRRPAHAVASLLQAAPHRHSQGSTCGSRRRVSSHTSKHGSKANAER